MAISITSDGFIMLENKYTQGGATFTSTYRLSRTRVYSNPVLLPFAKLIVSDDVNILT